MSFPVGASVTIEEMASNPHPASHRLRSAEPVSWVPALGGWMVTSRSLAIEVMRDWESFTVDDARFTTGQVVGPSMLSLDGEEHRRHREPFAEGYRTLRGHLQRFIADEATRLVTRLDHRVADLRADVANPLAVNVMAESLGLDATPAEVREIYDEIVGAVEDLSAGESVEQVDAMGRLATLVSVALEDGAGLLEHARSSLSPSEITSNVAVVMFGGVETSEAMIANTLWHLLSNPDQLARVVADRSLVAGAVEESLRLEPAATRVDRYTTRAISLDSVDLRAGDLVIVSLAGANRDPAVFTDPDRFDVSRDTGRLNVTFAHGPHACLASHVAREEAVTTVNAVLDHLPFVRLAPDAPPPSGLVFRKPERVPVAWG